MSPVSRMSVTCGAHLQATPRATADWPQQAAVPRRGLSDGGRWRKSQSGRPVTTGRSDWGSGGALAANHHHAHSDGEQHQAEAGERADGGAGLRDTVALAVAVILAGFGGLDRDAVGHVDDRAVGHRVLHDEAVVTGLVAGRIHERAVGDFGLAELALLDDGAALPARHVLRLGDRTGLAGGHVAGIGLDGLVVGRRLGLIRDGDLDAAGLVRAVGRGGRDDDLAGLLRGDDAVGVDRRDGFVARLPRHLLVGGVAGLDGRGGLECLADGDGGAGLDGDLHAGDGDGLDGLGRHGDVERAGHATGRGGDGHRAGLLGGHNAVLVDRGDGFVARLPRDRLVGRVSRGDGRRQGRGCAFDELLLACHGHGLDRDDGRGLVAHRDLQRAGHATGRGGDRHFAGLLRDDLAVGVNRRHSGVGGLPRDRLVGRIGRGDGRRQGLLSIDGHRGVAGNGDAGDGHGRGGDGDLDGTELRLVAVRRGGDGHLAGLLRGHHAVGVDRSYGGVGGRPGDGLVGRIGRGNGSRKSDGVACGGGVGAGHGHAGDGHVGARLLRDRVRGTCSGIEHEQRGAVRVGHDLGVHGGVTVLDLVVLGAAGGDLDGRLLALVGGQLDFGGLAVLPGRADGEVAAGHEAAHRAARPGIGQGGQDVRVVHVLLAGGVGEGGVGLQQHFVDTGGVAEVAVDLERRMVIEQVCIHRVLELQLDQLVRGVAVAGASPRIDALSNGPAGVGLQHVALEAAVPQRGLGRLHVLGVVDGDQITGEQSEQVGHVTVLVVRLVAADGGSILLLAERTFEVPFLDLAGVADLDRLEQALGAAPGTVGVRIGEVAVVALGRQPIFLLTLNLIL